LLIIKNIKLAEEKQSVALVGKRTIEDIKSAVGDNKNITKSGDDLVISALNFLKKEDSKESKDLTLTEVMSKEEESFNTTLYLDSNCNFCEVSGNEGIYEEEIEIKKAKGKYIKGTEPSASESTDEIGIDLNEDKLDEDKDNINKNIKVIEKDYAMAKDPSDSSDPEINANSISSNDGKYTLKVNIDPVGDKLRISIIDSKGTTLDEYMTEDLDRNKINNLNLHFNFKEYLKEKDKPLKDLQIYVYNNVEEENPNKVVTNVYIEKSMDLDLAVGVTVKHGQAYRINRGDDKNITKIGPLYNIKVKIAHKRELSKKESEKMDILFTGYSNKNINIEGNT